MAGIRRRGVTKRNIVKLVKKSINLRDSLLASGMAKEYADAKAAMKFNRRMNQLAVSKALSELGIKEIGKRKSIQQYTQRIINEGNKKYYKERPMKEVRHYMERVLIIICYLKNIIIY